MREIKNLKINRLPAILLLVLLCSSCATDLTSRNQGPWNINNLAKAPAFTLGTKTGLVQEVYYQGELFQGKPTRVYAWLGRPNNPQKKAPGMVLVHGGGGKAFKDWAEHWAKLGYVALAMDLSGNGPNGRLPDGGPDQSDKVKFRNFSVSEAQEMWTYHAIAAVIRGHSLLRSLPDVDANRTGITGISWGGYLTCIAAGVDSRFKVAVPVYGCGFLNDNSTWKASSLAAMTPESRDLWLKLFDPSEYLGKVRCPILFVNGTTDFAYPLDSYRKSYRLVPDQYRNVSVAINRPHGHIWTFPEVDSFVQSVLSGGQPLIKMGVPKMVAGKLTSSLDQELDSANATLCYTSDIGPWQKRKWISAPATISRKTITAPLPPERPLVAFLAVKDKSGNHISSEHLELE